MLALALRSLHASGVRWPLPAWNGGNICPTSTGDGPTPHDFGRYVCHRCGKLTAEGHRTLPMWRDGQNGDV